MFPSVKTSLIPTASDGRRKEEELRGKIKHEPDSFLFKAHEDELHDHQERVTASTS